MYKLVYFIFLAIFPLSCKEDFENKYIWHTIRVTATAYNSVKSQTDSNPNITAFGDSLKPGLKYIAVSNDLIKKGLKHNTPIKIPGFEGIYYVKDKMHPRMKNHIDIYMGLNIKEARAWGRKKISIEYGLPKEHITHKK